MRLDDKRTQVSITGLMGVEQRMPQKGETITYTGWIDAGIDYEHDHRGYAILHTAKKRQVWKESKYIVNDTHLDKCYNGLKQIIIEAYSIKTNIE